MKDNKDNINDVNQNNTSEVKAFKNHRFDIIALVLCFVAAVLVWLFVMNSNQEEIEKEIFVSVNVAEQIKNATGYDIISQGDGINYSQVIVTLTISGTQKAINNYDSDDFNITVKDLDKIKSVGVRTIQFNSPELPGSDITLVQMTPGYLGSVFIDFVTMREDVDLVAGYIGGIEVGKIDSLDPVKMDSVTGEYIPIDKITIHGPRSIIDTIDYVKVSVDISGYKKSTEIKSKTFDFYDASGIEIENNYNYIKVDPSEVDVQVTITYENKSIPIEIALSPPPEDGDKYKYEYTIADSLGKPAVLTLSGNSLYFTEFLIYELDISKLETDKIELTAEELKNLVPKGLVIAESDLNKKFIITVTKKEINAVLPEDSGVPDNSGDNSDSGPSSDNDPSIDGGLVTSGSPDNSQSPVEDELPQD